MADRRIRIAKRQAELVKRLMVSDEGTGPFRYQVDVLAFAAAVGAQRGRRATVQETAGDPIRMEVFERQNYVPLINLLAVVAADDPTVLADTDEMEERRATIFEEYACGGLDVLEAELRGAPDDLEGLLLLAGEERAPETPPGEFDLRELLD